MRDLYAGGSDHASRITDRVDDQYVGELATAVAGSLGGRVGIAPRVFLKKLVADVLDRVDQFEDYEPRQMYRLTLTSSELSETERSAAASSAGDVSLDLP